MKFRSILTLTAVFGCAFGIAYLIYPKPLLDFFGIEVSAGMLPAIRFFGGAIIGYGILAWTTRTARAAETTRAVGMTLFLACLIGLVLSTAAVINGFFNRLGWIAVVFFLISTAAFGYFRFLKRDIA